MNGFLQKLDETLWHAFDDGPLGLAIVDMNHRYVKINSRLSEIYGYTETEIRQFTFPEITYTEDMERDLILAEQIIAGELPYGQIEKRMIRKDGEAIWTNITASVLRSPEGEPLYGVSMVEDISERKTAEAQYIEIINRLQTAVDDQSGTPGGDPSPDKTPLGVIAQSGYSPLALTTAALEAIGLDDESFGFLLRYGRYAPAGAKYKISVGGLSLSKLSRRATDWFSLVGNPDFSIQVVDDGGGELTIYIRESGEI